MSGFIVKAACSGRRPNQFAGYSGYQRASLIAHLLKDRSVARFVVAPSGYGKTSLLVDYAETMFAWVHVFWINGQSPCFLRDLDEGDIAKDCMAVDKDVRLVIFDDVPALDATRAESFSHQIDELLMAKCEVIVACTPRCDVLGQLQRDRMRISARELLLGDDELDSARSAEERAQSPSAQLPDSCRVPALVWKETADSAAQFVKRSLREQMPADLLLGMSSMYALQEGSLESLTKIGSLDISLIGELAADYPHMGFDTDTGRFESPRVSVDVMAAGLKGVLDDIVSSSSCRSREQLVWEWANILLNVEHSPSRACDIVRVLCPRIKRAPWLAQHAEELVEQGCFYDGLMLARSIRLQSKDSSSGEKARCLAFESLCRSLLGDGNGAVRCAKRLAFDRSYGTAAQICGLLVVVRNGNDFLRQRACALLADIAAPQEGLPVETMSPWIQACVSWRVLNDGIERFPDWWDSLVKGGASPHVLCLTASWLYGKLATWYAERDDGSSPLLPGTYAPVESYLRDTLASSEEGDWDYHAASAVLALERAHMRGMPLSQGPLPSSTLLLLRRFEMSMLVQRTKLEQDAESEHDADGKWATGEARNMQQALSEITHMPPERNIPVLKIKMFGRFEVSIGSTPIADSAFRRKHVRLLLVLLAANLGRELSRVKMAQMLWPDTADEMARRNFYTAWSKLRKALSLPDGTCPYLVRHQFGCSLEARYVQCDIVRLNEICRQLLFGRPDFKGWAALYSEIDRDFSNEFLPSESSEEVIEQVRNDCRARLVDALVSATQSVIDGGNTQLALWFARSAVGHDETREDAYVALMRAQIANSQRTAAMLTYHKCRRVLAEQLGMDPSPETTALYKSLLDSI